MPPRHTPPLKPEIFRILLALDDGPLHGYGIAKRVEETTDGEISLAPSLLYRRLRRLLEDGLVEEGEEVPGEKGRPRQEYRLTAEGLRTVRSEARRLVALAGDEQIRSLASEADA